MSAAHSSKPLVLVTGAAGDIGESLLHALRDRYAVLGLDIAKKADGQAAYFMI